MKYAKEIAIHELKTNMRRFFPTDILIFRHNTDPVKMAPLFYNKKPFDFDAC